MSMSVSDRVLARFRKIRLAPKMYFVTKEGCLTEVSALLSLALEDEELGFFRKHAAGENGRYSSDAVREDASEEWVRAVIDDAFALMESRKASS